jgi:hypothetical protein
MGNSDSMATVHDLLEHHGKTAALQVGHPRDVVEAAAYRSDEETSLGVSARLGLLLIRPPLLPFCRLARDLDGARRGADRPEIEDARPARH